VRFRTQLLRIVACAPVVTTAACVTTNSASDLAESNIQFEPASSRTGNPPRRFCASADSNATVNRTPMETMGSTPINGSRQRDRRASAARRRLCENFLPRDFPVAGRRFPASGFRVLPQMDADERRLFASLLQRNDRISVLHLRPSAFDLRFENRKENTHELQHPLYHRHRHFLRRGCG
jgi:hypothetical protein